MLLLLLTVLVYSLTLRPVQTWLAKKAAGYLAAELKTTVDIKALYIKPFTKVTLGGLVILDREKDTLLNAGALTVDLRDVSITRKRLTLYSIDLANSAVYFKEYKNGTSNATFIINYFDSGKADTTKTKKPWDIRFNKVSLKQVNMRYHNYADTPSRSGIDFANLYLRGLTGNFSDIDFKRHLFSSRVRGLRFSEQSGFKLDDFNADVIVDNHFIEAKNLLIQTPKSRISRYYRMDYKDWKDFSDYVNKVKMTADFTNAHVAASDVAYFAPELARWKMQLDISGTAKGTVSNFKAKDLQLKTAKATYIHGDFTMYGLPDWRETFMEMRIKNAATTKAEFDEIINDVSGSKGSILPKEIARLGHINFKGNFTGYQNDFVAFADFKTQLGALKTDLNLRFDKKNKPYYKGRVVTAGFNLGKFLAMNELGRTTADLTVAGESFNAKTMNTHVNGKVHAVEYNRYNYNNINVDGTFIRNVFNGKVQVHDKNLALDFGGSVNLNGELPEYRFNAQVDRARLQRLHFTDKQLDIEASFKTDFKGSNLDNIIGRVDIQAVKLANRNGVFSVDSVILTARGRGNDRELTVHSDILDAAIQGTYDLRTLPDYYIAVAKKYIPALDTKHYTYRNQNFRFTLNVKDFTPIGQVLDFTANLPEGATFVGNFNSAENVATLNGIIRSLEYNNMRLENIILDESTSANGLQAIVTTDRLLVNDSVTVANINIANTLRNDSLALNIKLNTGGPENQLDLNALVQFTKNAPAAVSILPSVVRVNNDDWEISEKSAISFNKGETTVQNLHFSNKGQELIINGSIAKSYDSKLAVTFNKFNVSTLNPFLKGLRLQVKGELNGRSELYGILSTPRVNDNLTLTDLYFNNNLLGTLREQSTYAPETGLLTLRTTVNNAGANSLEVSGEVNMKAKTINAGVDMDEAKIAVLEPFVKSLVSDLKGTATARVKVTGGFSAPDISGNIKFNEAWVKVNYLNTPFKINDALAIRNNEIAIRNLELKDPEGHSGVANGTVSLHDLNNPVINVELKARNLLALNTTERENAVYYGKAYGTGVFKFTGPVHNMRIDLDAKTEEGTVFNLPLNSSETVSTREYINFVSKDSLKNVRRETSFEGLTLNFKLRVDNGTTANIYTSIGKLTGRGAGELTLNINSLGDFEMFGDYMIESGKFDFTAQEVINKQFDIRRGGTIRWTGNPTDATINLQAVYALRANLRDLYIAANRDVTNSMGYDRVNTEVEMTLTGLLTKPDIGLNIFFPSNPAIKEDLQAYFSDVNNLNLQAFSLIIRRSFAPQTGQAIGEQLSSSVTSTATELLFNQFNNVLASLNLDFVDFNIRSFNDASASFRFFNDRLIVNAGVADRRSNNPLSFLDLSNTNNLAGEIEALWLIKKDGGLIAKVANKPPTIQTVFLNTGINPYANVTSFGLIYAQQFDSFSELMRRIRNIFRKPTLRQRDVAESYSPGLNLDSIQRARYPNRALPSDSGKTR